MSDCSSGAIDSHSQSGEEPLTTLDGLGPKKILGMIDRRPRESMAENKGHATRGGATWQRSRKTSSMAKSLDTPVCGAYKGRGNVALMKNDAAGSQPTL